MNRQTGRIEEATGKKAKNGTPYASVKIDGEHYTCLDDRLISELAEGKAVEYQWDQSGKFKKIVDLATVSCDPELSPNELRILRMSTLRSAFYLEIGIDLPLDEKADVTMHTARIFERHIRGCDITESGQHD